MHVIKVRNVHEAIPEGFRFLSLMGEVRDSRNGKVLEARCPVATVYSDPMERVEFWPIRDSNPFFHFFEALWMLDGRNDVEFPTRFNSKFSQFSDDGETFNGAYGFRWRQHFNSDQLRLIKDRLKADKNDRRQVLSMWSGHDDIQNQNTKDLPCNTHAYFRIGSDGKLHMTVCNRSNDMIWGAYGSNAVHFSMLLEYMAAQIGVSVGTYTQMSNNFHAYKDIFEKMKILENEAPLNGGSMDVCWNPYRTKQVVPYCMMTSQKDVAQFDMELNMFLSELKIVPGIQNRFFRRVACPLLKAYTAFSNREAGPQRFREALAEMDGCEASDWNLACTQWIIRRQKKAEAGAEG